MYEVTPNYENLVYGSSRIIRGKATLGGVALQDTGAIQTISITHPAVGDALMGSALSAKITLTALDPSGQLMNVKDGAELSVSLGVENESTGAVEWVPFQTVTCDSVEYDPDSKSCTVSGFDSMALLDSKTFKDAKITYPATLRQIVEKAAAVQGLSVSSQPFFMEDTVYTQASPANLGGDETLRQVIAWAAEAALSNAIIGRDGKIHFISMIPGSPASTIDAKDYFAFEPNSVFGPINTFVLGRLPQEDNVFREDSNAVAQDGSKELRINDNPFLDLRRDDVIDQYFAKVNGLQVIPYTLDWRGNPAIDPGDVVQTVDSQNNPVAVLFGNSEIDFDGGLRFETALEIKSLTETDKSKATSVREIVRKTQIEVDKANQTITAIVEKTEGYDTQFSEIRQDLESITSTVSSQIGNLQEQIDGQIQTWFDDYVPSTSNAPANSWTTTTEKNNHLGDLFYIVNNSTAGGRAYRWALIGSVYQWVLIEDEDVAKALADAAKAQDTADGKRRVFVSQPKPPYDIGDLWTQGTNGDIMRCKVSRQSGNYVASDWVKASKYTDDAALNAFILGDFKSIITDLQNQADKKAETWYQNTDPSSAWNTTALKELHIGDIWYNTTTSVQKSYRWDGSKWQEMKTTPPPEVFDQIDGKAQIFISTPKPPYNVGDLWTQGPNGGLYRCNVSRQSGNYVAGDWGLATDYTNDEALEDFVDNVYSPVIEGIKQETSEIKQTVNSISLTVSSLEIGGRNYILNTARDLSVDVDSPSGFVVFPPVEYNVYFPNKSTLKELGFKVGDNVVLSFDWEISNVQTYGNFRTEYYGNSVDGSIVDGYLKMVEDSLVTFSESKKSGRQEFNLILTETTVNTTRFRFRIDNSVLTFAVKNLKLEKGTKATDWVPAFEDGYEAAQTIVTEATSEIKLTVNEISSTVSSHSKDISGIKEQNTEIQQNLDSISLTVSGIEIGGTNILRDSNAPTLDASSTGERRRFQGAITENESVVASWIEIPDAPEGIQYGAQINVVTSQTLGNQGLCFYTSTGVPLINGEKYTISCYARNTAGASRARMEIWGHHASPVSELSQTWERLIHTFTFNDSISTNEPFALFQIDTSIVGTTQMCGFKIERGGYATDWYPAPEDIPTFESVSDDINKAVQKVVTDTTAQIKVETDKIAATVSENTESITGLEKSVNNVSSTLTQTKKDITAEFSQVKENISSNSENLNSYKEEVETYIRFSSAGIELGEKNNPLSAELKKDRLSFLQNGEEIAYVSNNKLYITNAEVLDRFTVGNSDSGYFDWVPRANGNLGMKWRES